ncbi:MULTISPECIES: hypothetical protein [Ralstonia]|uniref:hypothetical protein n=1 Tax=Ralstonia TaxID=48736 RepID=UPI0003A0AA74|nr:MULTISPECIES: hypothetical protein [Ralstonia]MBL4778427.1 hypothetical protein [Ralstonia sp.]MCM3582130.1 hypothetical protein [Ralstonia pickettii]
MKAEEDLKDFLQGTIKPKEKETRVVNNIRDSRIVFDFRQQIVCESSATASPSNVRPLRPRRT